MPVSSSSISAICLPTHLGIECGCPQLSRNTLYFVRCTLVLLLWIFLDFTDFDFHYRMQKIPKTGLIWK
ncbi:hypothetical protein Mp_6g15070 [Marchantia polymorpha subsp. ruderalis]|uniref:Uncharacterized protein n=2 Tax=Marchantia polymorpha TaxID=3197 RepID=A0AAF6BS73_MARPO|nr:hypothetical protein MARPO_0056s0017 [Marchantia polymorpha]BBN14857.1 hypothetical protein Mp_6g15070 [Marchantia polymorpha subsp. ruderalis]|eukprot:PTQ37538.1 hypothetical protein MARPO_0056s0017 [Marchantia polymorpha]